MNFFIIKYLLHYNYNGFLFLSKSTYKNIFIFNKIWLKSVNNFFKALFYICSLNTKILLLQENNTLSGCYNYIYSDVDLFKYDIFFNSNYKILQNHFYFLIFKDFLIKLNVKSVIVIDYARYLNYLSFFNYFDIYKFAIIPNNFVNLYCDFYILSFSKSLIYKYLFCSIIYSVWHHCYLKKLYLIKIDYFNKFKFLNYYT